MKLSIVAIALQVTAAAAADTDQAAAADAMAKLRGGVSMAADFLASQSCLSSSDCEADEFCKFNLANW